MTSRYPVDTPNMMHFMDKTVLTRVATEAGFQVEKMKELARKDYPSVF